MGPSQTPPIGKPPKAARTTAQWIRLGLSVAMLGAAALYIDRVLQGQSADLRAAISTLSVPRFAIGLVLATLTLACPTLYHVITVERLSPIRGARGHIAAAYALSQLVRYVPGKVFGVLFEVNYLRGVVDANVLVLANTVQMFYQYAAAALFILLVTGVFFSEWPWLWGLAAIAAVVVFFAHRQGWSESTLLWIVRKTPGIRRSITASISSGHMPLAATTWLTVDWVFFIGMWYIFNLGTSHLTPYALLAACYAAASMLGALVVVMPSGLVVREGLFIWMAHALGFDPVALVAYATAIRIWLTAGDILIALIFGLADRLRGIDTHA